MGPASDVRGEEAEEDFESLGIPAIVGSRVSFVLDPAAIAPGGEVRDSVVQEMVDALIVSLTGRRSPGAAWRSLLNPETDVAGIRVSASGQKVSGTRLATALAVVRGLRAIGFPREKIIVWDRNLEDLLAAGYVRNHPDYTLRWIEAHGGYDPDAPVTAPLLGRLIWGDSQFASRGSQRFSDLLGSSQQLSSNSYFARVLTREVTKVIHIPSLQDSFLTGINGAIAGMVVNNIDNWRRFTNPPYFGDPYVAEIYASEVISGKVIVTFLDALFLQFAGGPFPNPAQTMENATIFASYDPVAIDFTARGLLDETRQIHRLPALGSMTGYIETAAQMGMGVAEDSKIQLRRIKREDLR